jgi:hypothetical protein
MSIGWCDGSSSDVSCMSGVYGVRWNQVKTRSRAGPAERPTLRATAGSLAIAQVTGAAALPARVATLRMSVSVDPTWHEIGLTVS